VAGDSSLVNPFATTASASSSMASLVFSSSDSEDDLDLPQPASAATIQTVNIRSHVTILLEFDDSNYS
jgi:hypothetical protein